MSDEVKPSPAPTESPAEAEAPPPPAPPPEVPRPSRRAPFDADIEKQMEAALAGLDEKALLGEPEKHPHSRQPEDRTKKGRVVALHADDVFVDVGGRSQGVLPLNQFPDGAPKIGDTVDVEIEGYDRANGLLLVTRQGAAQRVEDWSSVNEGMIVEARVTGTNKGGLEVDVNGLRGFIPISHVELFRAENTAPYVNQRLLCEVTEVKPEERNLVLSRRAILEKEREEAREKTWNTLAEGQVRKGVVRTVKDFGAFVDLGGVDALLHVSDMSWARVDSADKVVQPGQSVEVKILKIDQEKRKLSVGLKQLGPSPWDDVSLRFPLGTVAPGKVTRLMDFGAFVELEPGIEGLVHISELAPQRVRRVGDIVKAGQDVQVKVLKVEPSQRRISLSIKATIAAPEPPPEPAESETSGKKKKGPPPRRTPLKGGLGS